MKLIKLSKKENDEDWSMRFVDDDNADLIINEDTKVLKPDGSVLCVVLKKALSKENVGRAWSVLKDYNQISRNRSTAAGRENELTKKHLEDGTVVRGNTQDSVEGWEVQSGIVGFFERTVRMPYCRPCAWNANNPEKWAALLPMVKEVNDLYKKNVPDRYKNQKKIADKTSPEFVIPDSVFTTLTINKNFRTACHLDAGDLADGISCMSLIRQGAYKGGNLIFPNWRVGANLDTYDLIIFDPHEFHGNTQIIKLTEDAQRCTVVYYYREEMQKCLTAAQELDQAKSRKPGMSLW